jgi:hypothetical protein
MHSKTFALITALGTSLALAPGRARAAEPLISSPALDAPQAGQAPTPAPSARDINGTVNGLKAQIMEDLQKMVDLRVQLAQAQFDTGTLQATIQSLQSQLKMGASGATHAPPSPPAPAPAPAEGGK